MIGTIFAHRIFPIWALFVVSLKDNMRKIRQKAMKVAPKATDQTKPKAKTGLAAKDARRIGGGENAGKHVEPLTRQSSAAIVDRTDEDSGMGFILFAGSKKLH